MNTKIVILCGSTFAANICICQMVVWTKLPEQTVQAVSGLKGCLSILPSIHPSIILRALSPVDYLQQSMGERRGIPWTSRIPSQYCYFQIFS